MKKLLMNGHVWSVWMNKDVREKILDNMLLPEALKDMIRKDMEEDEK